MRIRLPAGSPSRLGGAAIGELTAPRVLLTRRDRVVRRREDEGVLAGI